MNSVYKSKLNSVNYDVIVQFNDVIIPNNVTKYGARHYLSNNVSFICLGRI